MEALFSELTRDLSSTREKLTACWKWVASQVRYVRAVKGKLCIGDRCFFQDDLWQDPSTTIHTLIGNCANSAMLLASLVRNALPSDQAYCALGNLHSSTPGGHAWVKVVVDGEDFIMEATSPKAPALVPEGAADRYEPVHYFNDKEVLAVTGRTQLVPYAVAYSDWLADYLNWAYIKGHQAL